MANWKKVIVSGSSGVELNSLTLKGAAGTIVNESTVAASRLTGSFTGSFVGSFTNSDGSTVGAQTLQQTMALGSTTSVPITSSNTSVMLTGSGAVQAGTVTAQTSVTSADFDVIAAGNATLFDTVGANDLTIGAGTTTVKTTLLESATSVKSDDFDVLTAQDITIFDTVADNSLTIGATNTTVKIVGDLVELGDGASDVVTIKGSVTNDSTVAATKLTGSFTGSFVGDATLATAAVSDLTDNQVVIAGTNGELEGDANLTFSSNTLSGTGLKISALDITGSAISASTSLTARAATVTSLNNNNGLVFTDANGALENGTDITYNGTTLSLASGKGIKNQSTVAGTQLTGSMTGSFVGSFTNSDGTSVGSQTLQQTMALGSTTSVPITSSNTSVMLTGSGEVKAGTVTAADSVSSDDFDVLVAQNVTLFDTVGANDLTIGAGTTTVKTTLLESATSVKSDDFDVLTAQNVTLFDTVGNNNLTIGASTTTVILPGDLIELGNGAGDVVDIKGNLQVSGTSSFNHSTNLSVADKYILLNSGSEGSNSDSGGIVIQGPNNGIGELFGYVSGSSENANGINRRWGIASNFDATASADFVADAFMSTAIVDTAASNPAVEAYEPYSKPGNIYSGNDGEIYIYAQ